MKEITVNSYLGCPHHPDAGLTISEATCNDSGDIEEATLTCRRCAHTYRIVNGIAYMLPGTLSEISRGESIARDKDADDYASKISDYETQIEDRFLLDGIRLCPYALIVDVGAGEGRYTHKLASLGGEVLALDISPGMLQLNRLKAQKHLPPAQSRRIDFVVADAANLPLKSTIAPLVISSQMLEHLPPDNHLRCLKEMRRLLIANGEARLTAYNQIVTTGDIRRGLKEPRRLFKIVKGNLPGEERSKTKSGYHGNGDLFYYYFTDIELRRLLGQAELRVRRLTGILSLPRRLQRSKAAKRVERIISARLPLYARSRGQLLGVVATAP